MEQPTGLLRWTCQQSGPRCARGILEEGVKGVVGKHTKVMQYHPEGNARQVLDRLMSLESCVDAACKTPAIGHMQVSGGVHGRYNRASKQIRVPESSHWRGALSMDRSVRRRAED